MAQNTATAVVMISLCVLYHVDVYEGLTSLFIDTLPTIAITQGVMVQGRELVCVSVPRYIVLRL